MFGCYLKCSFQWHILKIQIMTNPTTCSFLTIMTYMCTDVSHDMYIWHPGFPGAVTSATSASATCPPWRHWQACTSAGVSRLGISASITFSPWETLEYYPSQVSGYYDSLECLQSIIGKRKNYQSPRKETQHFLYYLSSVVCLYVSMCVYVFYMLGTLFELELIENSA